VQLPTFHPPGLSSICGIDVARGVRYPEEPARIEGLVGDGSGGWDGPGGEYRVHCITLDAWRAPGGLLRRGRLVALRPIGPSDDLFDVVDEGDFVRLQAFLAEDHERCVVVGGETFEGDDELLRERARLRTPVVHRSPRFGDLVLDRRFGVWNGEATFAGSRVRLSLEPASDEAIEAPRAQAEALFASEAEWKRRVDDYAVEQLLELKNESWLRDGESPLSREDFLARMTLRTITVDDEGRFGFWHDDGGLFWGHAILVGGTLADGPDDADIPG